MSIKDHLPQQTDRGVPVQGFVPRELHEQVAKLKGKITWTEFLVACFKQYVAENPAPAKPDDQAS